MVCWVNIGVVSMLFKGIWGHVSPGKFLKIRHHEIISGSP